MSMNYGDDYFEPSEFEMLIDDWKETLKQSVKKEYQDEMERLRKENAELIDIQNNWAEKCRELEVEKDKYRRATVEAKSEAKKARLHELLEPYNKPAWGVKSRYEYIREKCDKCDKNGYIHYKTPMGRDAREECSCRRRRLIYEPAEAELVEISQYYTPYTDKEVKIFFKYNKGKSCGYDVDEYEKTKNVYSGQDFKDIERYYGIVFLDKEKCQEYCNWLNEIGGEGMTVKELKEELNYYDDDANLLFGLDDDVDVESTTVDKYGFTTVRIDSYLKPDFIGELNGDCNIMLVSDRG